LNQIKKHKEMNLNAKRIAFFDLDGTLIETVSGKTFAEDCTDFRLKKDVLDKIRGIKSIEAIAIVSNQGGIPKHCSMSDFLVKIEAISHFIQRYCHKVVTFEFCTSEDSLSKRKPNTGMLEDALKYRPLDGFVNSVEKSEMLMIGDASGKPGQFSDSDKKCAENFGIDYLDVEDFLKA